MEEGKEGRRVEEREDWGSREKGRWKGDGEEGGEV